MHQSDNTSSREVRLNLRLTAHELAEVTRAARAAGLRPGSFARFVLLRASRREARATSQAKAV